VGGGTIREQGWEHVALHSMALDVVRSASIDDHYFIECLGGKDDATKRLRLAIVSLSALLRAAF